MKIGIVGATGAVGRQMIECLEERNIQVEELKLFASERSLGKTIKFNEKDIPLEVANENSFDDLDYVFGAVSNELSKQYASWMKGKDVVYIDNSSAFRLQEDVPLVVPEINGEDALHHNGIIANPNCSTIITMMAISPIQKLSPIKKLVATTFQAVSGAGIGGLRELRTQSEALAKGEDIEVEVFPKQIAYNVIAQIGSYDETGFTSEELKMGNEGRKILHNDDMKVNCTCVRVPVYRSHSISCTFTTVDYLDMDAIKEALSHMEGVQYFKNDIPTPLDTTNQDDVFVGRLRRDPIEENGLTLWCCGDQIRKGAATNAIQIMSYMELHK